MKLKTDWEIFGKKKIKILLRKSIMEKKNCKNILLINKMKKKRNFVMFGMFYEFHD